MSKFFENNSSISLHREGGSALGAFDLGVMQGLKEIGVTLDEFKYTAATSAACANSLGSAIGLSTKEIWGIWENVISKEGFYEKKYEKLHLHRIIEYCRDRNLGKFIRLKRNRLLIPLYNKTSKKVVWFDSSKKTFAGEEITRALSFQIIVGAMALPGFHDPIKIGKYEFFDPGLAYEAVPFPEIESKKKLVVRTKPKFNNENNKEKKKKSFSNIYKHFREHMWEIKYFLTSINGLPEDYKNRVKLRNEVSDKLEIFLEKERKKGNVYIIRPEHKFDRRDFSLEALKKSFNHGREQVKKQEKEILKFLGIKKSPLNKFLRMYGRFQSPKL